MLKAYHLGVTLSFFLALLGTILSRPLDLEIVLPNTDFEPFVSDEGTVRNERSANLSHIIGRSRKIQMVVNKVMLLQISPDGTVSGTEDDNDYTILQRASVNNYQIKFQGVATCQFLCMDHCGLLYGSREFTDDCLFNEMIERHNFNTYSSAKYSNDKRTLYLALNKKGMPRKVQTKAKTSLGKFETYTNVLTNSVPEERVEALVMKILKSRALLGKFLQNNNEGSIGNHHLLRHHGYSQLCPNVPFVKVEDKNKFQCRKREKRKKKKKCDEDESDECQQVLKKKPNFVGKKKCEEGEEEEECQKRLQMIRKKRKSRNGESEDANGIVVKNKDDKKRKRRLKNEKKKSSEKVACENSDGKNNCISITKKTNNRKMHKQSNNEKMVVNHSPYSSSEFFSKVVSFSFTDTTTEKNVMDYEIDTTTDSHETLTINDEETVTDTSYDWTTSSAVPN